MSYYWYLGYPVCSEVAGDAFSDLVRRNSFQVLRAPPHLGDAALSYNLVVLADNRYVFVPLWTKLQVSHPWYFRWEFAEKQLGVPAMTGGFPFEDVNMHAPLLIERPQLHGNGGHVMWTDGTVEFIQYPGKFPMTEKFIAALEELDPQDPSLE